MVVSSGSVSLLRLQFKDLLYVFVHQSFLKHTLYLPFLLYFLLPGIKKDDWGALENGEGRSGNK